MMKIKGNDVNGKVRVTSARHSVMSTIRASILRQSMRMLEDMLFYNLIENTEMALSHIFNGIILNFG